jgi:hypothetical protein
MSSGWGLSWVFMLRRWIGIERVERPDSHVVSDREVVAGCFHSFKTHGAGFSALPYRQTRKRSAARDLRRHRGLQASSSGRTGRQRDLSSISCVEHTLLCSPIILAGGEFATTSIEDVFLPRL